MSIQWLSNNVAIPDATGLTYKIDRTPFSANGAKFALEVSNAQGTVTSQEATLTVTAAAKPLNLLYATATRTFNGVRVWFSDPLDPTTAETASNYQLSGGVMVTSAQLVAPAGSPGDNMVDLVTSAQTPGQAYTLTVNGVKAQTAGNITVPVDSTVQFSAWTIIQGSLLFEHWDNLSGAGIGNMVTALEDPRVVANTPTTLGLANKFDTRTVFPDDSHESYLVRMSGWITPTESGDYYFFIRSDDASRLYLSADDAIPDPNIDSPIAIEADCCDAFAEPTVEDPATTATPISLVEGRRYGILALLKEGGGGDYMMVAWRKSTSETPAAELPNIPGQFLSTYIDPNVDLVISKQPVDQAGIVASAGIEIVSRDFNADNGSFTVVNTTPPPPGPWVYNATSGKWAADGSEDACTGPYNSQLNSPGYKLASDGAVSIAFSHRYSFESGLYDGGQVRLSVNGGPFNPVPAANFTANGYAEGTIVGTGVINGQRAFNADSPGYAGGQFVVSKASLGAFRKDDTLVIQFIGAWDECSPASHPSWEIDSMSLTLLPMITKDFTADNGGFAVVNTAPPPPGPWVYADGAWTAGGSGTECTGPFNSALNSTALVVPESDEVTLSFLHRYSFESGLWDGGQVRLSVNGGPFNPVTGDKFTANGYAESPIVGTGVLNGQRAFNGDSAGYAGNSFITSSAVLGTFNKNDSLVIQFLGAWDECSNGSTPSWQIKNMQLSIGKAAKASTFEVTAAASHQGTPVPVTYQWQRDNGAGYVDISGATGPSLRIFPVAADFTARFRAAVSVPGKTIYSSVVKLTGVETPTISVARTANGVVVTYTGTLQSSATVNGTYQNVNGAQNPYTVPNPGTAIFFRAAR